MTTNMEQVALDHDRCRTMGSFLVWLFHQTFRTRHVIDVSPIATACLCRGRVRHLWNHCQGPRSVFLFLSSGRSWVQLWRVPWVDGHALKPWLEFRIVWIAAACFWINKLLYCTLTLCGLPMDCRGLAVAWEGLLPLREKVRGCGKLITHPSTQKFCVANRANCKENAEILKPILGRMAEHPKNALPHLEPLQAELLALANKLGLPVSEKGVYQPAVEIKRLAGFVKRRVNRGECTKEPRGSICAFWVLCGFELDWIQLY